MRLKTRILAGVVFAICIPLVIGTIAVTNVSNMRAADQRLFYDGAVPLEIIPNVAESFERMRIALRDLLESESPEAAAVAILVEDFPANQRPSKLGQHRQLLLGIFHGVPATKRSVFNLPTGPDHIVLYQKNIEAVCSSEAEVRHQIRQTLIHELGHYFGMTEEQLRDV